MSVQELADARERRHEVPRLLPARSDGEGWEAQARCRREDPALFFGPSRFEPKHERLAREAAAKAICASCPALVPCRQQALAQGERYGVWGGLGESDRRGLVAEGGQQVATAV